METVRPAQLEGVPSRLEAAIGNGLEGYYAVELKRHHLLWSFGRAGAPQQRAQVTPSASTWKTFARLIDEVDIFSWSNRYENLGVRDGTYWQLALTWCNRTLETSGANAFPAHFDRFCSGVEALLDGPTFR